MIDQTEIAGARLVIDGRGGNKMVERLVEECHFLNLRHMRAFFERYETGTGDVFSQVRPPL